MEGNPPLRVQCQTVRARSSDFFLRPKTWFLWESGRITFPYWLFRLFCLPPPVALRVFLLFFRVPLTPFPVILPYPFGVLTPPLPHVIPLILPPLLFSILHLRHKPSSFPSRQYAGVIFSSHPAISSRPAAIRLMSQQWEVSSYHAHRGVQGTASRCNGQYLFPHLFAPIFIPLLFRIGGLSCCTVACCGFF